MAREAEMVETLDYCHSPLPLRDDLVGAHQRAWARLGAPGEWWTGAERVAIAKETRAAMDCGLCRDRRAALVAPRGHGHPHLHGRHRAPGNPGRGHTPDPDRFGTPDPGVLRERARRRPERRRVRGDRRGDGDGDCHRQLLRRLGHPSARAAGRSPPVSPAAAARPAQRKAWPGCRRSRPKT